MIALSIVKLVQISETSLQPESVAMSVQHEPQQHSFIFRDQGVEARLEYRLLQRNGRAAVDFYHTFVPPAFRGQGIAARLTDAGLAWARQQQLLIEASCSYVARQLNRSHSGE